MFQDDDAPRPFAPRPRGAGSPSFDQLEAALARDRQDRKRLRRALLAAGAAHLLLFFIVFPQGRDAPLQVAASAPRAYVVQQVRFKPPAPRPQQPVPKRQTKKIPIPDPTPDDPEPIRVAEELELDPEVPTVGDAISDDYILDNLPPGPPSAGPVLRVTGDVTPPVKVYAPPPVYTEEARLARIQGVVVLQAVIDREGNVDEIKVLKGLPAQLTERAIETVKTWKFEPSTLQGEPVAVYYNLTISFSLA